MGFFSSILNPIGSILGGGSGTTAEASQSTNNTTNVNIDLEPLGKILADSQAETAVVYANGLEQSAQLEKEAQTINLVNSELDRQVEISKQNKLDGYLEHAKNGLVLSVIVAGLLYAAKKKKGGKKK